MRVRGETRERVDERGAGGDDRLVDRFDRDNGPRLSSGSLKRSYPYSLNPRPRYYSLFPAQRNTNAGSVIACECMYTCKPRWLAEGWRRGRDALIPRLETVNADKELIPLCVDFNTINGTVLLVSRVRL